MKRLYYDLETTGTNPAKHSIHQIAGMVVIDKKIIEKFDIKMQPNPNALIDPEALKVGNVTEEDFKNYVSFGTGYNKFINILNRHCDKFNKNDKFHLVGYNNRKFDDNFLRGLFLQNGDKFMGSYFWGDTIDVMSCASLFLEDQRHLMENFKLKTVARYMGIAVDEAKLHDALYDIELTGLILDKIQG